MAGAVGLHKHFQRVFGLDVIHRRMVDATGQRPTHQYRCAVANPLAHRIHACWLAAKAEQHRVHRCRQVGNRVDQRAIQIEHHQPWQFAREQLLKTAHGRVSASSERILSMTS